MSFLYRPKDARQGPAIENVPPKHIRSRTMGASHIIRRVSSIFLSKKKPLPDLKLANSVAHHRHTIYSPSCSSSSRNSVDSEDDIRRPSGLGRAVSMMSNRSLPPSPFMPPSESSSYPSQDYQRIRALSSPNLVQSFNKGRVKQRFRRASVSQPLIKSLPPLPPLPPISARLPKEVIVRILFYLSRGTIASCSQVSRPFAAAARYSLYNTLNFDSLSLLQLEQLLALLASRRDLTELVSTLICHKWPPFFIPDCHCRGSPPTGYVFQQKDALLTATFTLALERMINITSLILPAFDASLLSHHTAFGLKRLTFMNYTISESDARALFSWLDGQTNIVSLRFMNLEDVSTPIKNPYRNSISGILETTPTSPFLKSPATQSISYSAKSQQQSLSRTPTVVSPFRSPNLLPNLVELHATPFILTLLALPPQPSPSLSPSPPSSLSQSFSFPLILSPTPLPVRRPLTIISLNITTTLYTGLRPATLMSPLRGISHLCLKFGRAVDRRTFEKVVGAAGGVLGGREGEEGTRDGGWIGLRSLEIGFQDSSPNQSRRDEALYKALQISLPRYKSLQSLRLFIPDEAFVDDHHHHHHQYQHHLEHYRNCLTNGHDHKHADDERNNGGRTVRNNNSDFTLPSGVEQTLIDLWLNLCPSLEVVTLFSGAQWRKELDDRRELWS